MRCVRTLRNRASASYSHMPAASRQSGIRSPRCSGKDEGQRPDQVRRDAQQDAPLAVGLEHEPEVAGLQIAEAAVHQPARARAGARAEVVLLDQHGPEPAHGRVARHAGAGDAAADDEQVGGLRRSAARAWPAPRTDRREPAPRSAPPPSQHLVSLARSSDPARDAGARSGVRRRPAQPRRGGARRGRGRRRPRRDQARHRARARRAQELSVDWRVRGSRGTLARARAF